MSIKEEAVKGILENLPKVFDKKAASEIARNIVKFVKAWSKLTADKLNPHI